MSGTMAKPEDTSLNLQRGITSISFTLTSLLCSFILVVIAVVIVYLRPTEDYPTCCLETQKSLSELKIALDNIHKQLESRKTNTEDKHGNFQYPVIIEDGTRWRAFWWYKKSSGWPRCPDDVLEGEYGSCDPEASYCFGRLPSRLAETGAEMLGKDSAGHIYRWSFDATNPTAHAAWKAFHDHLQTPAGTILNSHVWNPKVIAGNKPKAPQDSFMYRSEHGVTSLLLDDDNCDCLSSLSLGHGMCGATFSTDYGPSNRFGVDPLFDDYCQTPSPDNGLTLYFKDDDNCVGVQCGQGLKCVDNIDTYSCVEA